MKMPYMARVLFGLRPVAAPGLGTFAVDGRMRLYVDFAAMKDKPFDFCAQALLHEASHILAGHASIAESIGVNRRDPQQAQDWNASADMAINDDLSAAGCKALIEGGALLPSHINEPDNQTAIHYWDAIRQLRQQNAPSDRRGQDDPDQGQPGEGDQGEGQQDAQQDDSGQGGAGQRDDDQPAEPYTGCGSGSGAQAAPCELGTDDLDGAAPGADDHEVRSVQIATAAAIRDHKSRGTVPAGLAEVADEILTPSPTAWQRILGSHVRRCVAKVLGDFDVDYTRRSRRRFNECLRTPDGQIAGRVIIPGMYSPTPRIEFIRDTSGSMSADDLAMLVNEIESIARKVGVRGDALRVTDVDAAVHASRGFTHRNDIFEVTGRGGTDMCVGIENAYQRKDRADVIVVGTDGYTPWPDERGPVPVIACILATEQEYLRPPGWIKTVWIAPQER